MLCREIPWVEFKDISDLTELDVGRASARAGLQSRWQHEHLQVAEVCIFPAATLWAGESNIKQ